MKVLLYFPLFILGLIAGFFYFSHLWKSINIFGTEKNKILMSMLIRLPIPIAAVLVAAFIAGVGGIISVLVGFTVFQIVFLVKMGIKLKKEVEAEALKEENQHREK
jgi:fatty acid desaturase